VIIGGAIGKVVTSLVNDIIMPPIGMLLGGVDMKGLFVTLGKTQYDTIEEAKAAGAATINYGLFLNAVVDFVIIAFCIYMITKIAMKPAPTPPPPPTKECQQCAEQIPVKAKRCKYCTSPA
jgi:large conductance mechanosensitive channel